MDTKLDDYQSQSLKLEPEAHSIRYLLGSTVLHLSLLASALLVSELIPKPEPKDLIEISVQDIAPEPTKSPISQAPVISPEPPRDAPKKVTVLKKETPKIVQKPILEKPTVPKAIVKAPVVEKQTADDIENETEDLPQVSIHPLPVSELKDSDVDEDLNRVDQEQAKVVTNLKNEIDESTQKVLAEQDKDLNDMQRESERQSEALTKHLAQMKQEDNARVKQALEKEFAARRTAEEHAAAAEAAAKRVAQARVAEESARASAESARAAQLAKETALGNSLGLNIPVKALQDLKQLPGNPHPQYDSEDRLAARQGEVDFLAYVEIDGRITKFKLLRTTGYRSLDAKTFAAIRNWKFYPGQQGWVEIPFKWDLKGGAQEMPATLRRSISQK
jgi:TonB family protein